MKVVASAPAKTILLGEHFVVYDEPAIALAIDKRVKVQVKTRSDMRVQIEFEDLTVSAFLEDSELKLKQEDTQTWKKIEPIWFAVQEVMKRSQSPLAKTGLSMTIHSSIPVASGLGSSAATAAATVAAISKLVNVELSAKEIFRLTYEAEKLFHGTPSGIDPATATYGGALLFRKNAGFKQVDVKGEIPLVIGNTGVRRSTGEYVARVRTFLEQQPKIIQPIIKTGGEIVNQAVEALKQGDLELLGRLMNINHGLLSAVGVSHPKLEQLVYAAREAGALGAKLTGGGGGGCMVALCRKGSLTEVAAAIEHVGGSAMIAKKTDIGVKVDA